MVYFIAHVVYNNGLWLPITSIPVDIVNMSQDMSSRTIHKVFHSIQLVYQPTNRIYPMLPVVIKTTFIKQIQTKFRRFLKMKKFISHPKQLFKREIGLFNPH